MHLKSLTLKGFKSFASATSMRFEPGITCVVGPNGTGKSNVVDALSWVMGQQGAKTLRGGSMQDVIFAGTSGRSALGRAEVTVTIDNADGALPIDYTEVSITRRVFRDGASEYEINGSQCRLLDVQELLSDSGIGREMHVVVGQGQLDQILQSKPEERRALIEEAAGVRKHRQRKDKALRKLDAMQGNLTRLTDLTTELSRQLKPLGKQAELARRAQTVQAELRDARLRLAADDLVTLRADAERGRADESATRQRRAEVERAAEAARTEQAELDKRVADDASRLTAAHDTRHQLATLAERISGTTRLAAERARHLSTAAHEQRTPGRDPDDLEREADRAAAEQAERGHDVDRAQASLTEQQQRCAELERRHSEAERAHLAAVHAAAGRREGIAQLSGRVEALRSKATAAGDEIQRLCAARDDARGRAGAARAEHDERHTELSALDSTQLGLDTRHEHAAVAHEAASRRVRELEAALRDAEQDRAWWQARVEALQVGLGAGGGAEALLTQDQSPSGLVGSAAGMLSIEPGMESAIAAALGAAADALVVTDLSAATEVLRLLRERDAGRAGLVIGGSLADPAGPCNGEAPTLPTLPTLPTGTRWAADLVTATGPAGPALTRLLARTAVVDDLASAAALVADAPTVRAVTRDGDVLARDWGYGGCGPSRTTIEVQAAVDGARAEQDQAQRRIEQRETELHSARAEQTARGHEAEQALTALRETDAAHAAASDQLRQLDQTARTAAAEADRLQAARDDVDTQRRDVLSQLAEQEQQLRHAEQDPGEDQPDTTERDEAAAAVAAARSDEVEARLTLRTAEERAQALHGRADELRRAGAEERDARHRAAATSAARKRAAEVATEVARAGELAEQRIQDSLARAEAERDAARTERSQREQALDASRRRARELANELEQLTDAVHRDEMARAEQRLRLEQLESRIGEEFGIGLDDLLADYGPDVPVAPPADEVAEYEAARDRGEQVTAPQPTAYDRATQQRRARRAERDLNQLGKVNPLALEEYAALEERYKFLSGQLEDLTATRRDLLTVVEEVDEKILQVFSSAFADVAAEFETVFAALFPGGSGQLVLTDPDHPLSTGVEVEARPPGKKITRLSLLSGGEKSLTAVALLLAIFRARPSPFYVLDEVEAALDDTNLRRLLGLFEQLRGSSQLIVITHQKPTMEIADALYGVSMRGDGITTVISQRLRDGAA